MNSIDPKPPREYVAAPPGELYWRHEKCPHRGAKVLLLTIGNVCIVGAWRGEVGDFFRAWCPLPKDEAPRAEADCRPTSDA